MIEVGVWLSAARRQQMWKVGREKDIPPIVHATFIVDTGADSTMVNDQIVRTLGLSPTSQTMVYTSESRGVAVPCDVYDIELQILNKSGDAVWTMQPLPVLARPLLNQAIEGMIGRDVLDRCVLSYDGPNRTFTLSHS